MNKLRTASAVLGAVAAVAIGGAAFAAGNDDPTPGPSASDDRGGSVEMLPDGTVVTTEPADDNPSPDDSASATPSPSVSAPAVNSPRSIGLDAAKAIAIRVAGGGYVQSAERETEHGRAVWDIDVIRNGVEHDIDVDRATGDVTRHRVKDRSSDSGSTSPAESTPTSSATHDAGDDHGSSGHGSSGHGSSGHGSDDKGGDDHGSGGHGSDD